MPRIEAPCAFAHLKKDARLIGRAEHLSLGDKAARLRVDPREPCVDSKIALAMIDDHEPAKIAKAIGIGDPAISDGDDGGPFSD